MTETLSQAEIDSILDAIDAEEATKQEWRDREQRRMDEKKTKIAEKRLKLMNSLLEEAWLPE